MKKKKIQRYNLLIAWHSIFGDTAGFRKAECFPIFGKPAVSPKIECQAINKLYL